MFGSRAAQQVILLFEESICPYKWTKQIPSFFSGTRNGMAISWPARIKDKGGARWKFHQLIDIVPTILEVGGIPAPLMVDGIAQKPIEGFSLAYTFDEANAKAPSLHHTQYFEMMGVHGLYNDGWMLSAQNESLLLGPALLSRASELIGSGSTGAHKR